jgi:uncharacterized protein (TIGR02996 family)
VDDTSFLRAICWSPFDDGPRLVYADWLEERGECARAEFIRVQVALAANPGLEHCTEVSANWCLTCGDCRCPEPEKSKYDEACPLHRPDSPHGEYEALRRRERELLLSPPPGSAYSRAEFWTPTVLRAGAVACEVSTHPPSFRSLRSGMAWGFRRGLVGSVTLTAEQFLGGPCGRCRGSGRSRNQYGEDTGFKCIVCRGTGRVEGLAAALFRAAPITEVRLSDKHPSNSTQYPSLFGWLPEAPELSALRQLNPAEFLPYEVWDLLDAISPEVILTHYRPLDTGHWKWFASERDALVGLSAACVAYGRSLTHPPLPPLTGAPATESKR